MIIIQNNQTKQLKISRAITLTFCKYFRCKGLILSIKCSFIFLRDLLQSIYFEILLIDKSTIICFFLERNFSPLLIISISVGSKLIFLSKPREYAKKKKKGKSEIPGGLILEQITKRKLCLKFLKIQEGGWQNQLKTRMVNFKELISSVWWVEFLLKTPYKKMEQNMQKMLDK